MAITLTARRLITDALLELGAVGSGESLKPNEAADCLRWLNELIDAWQTQRLTMRTSDAVTAAIVAGQATYTVGAGGDFDVERPTFVETLMLRMNSASPPVEIELGPLTEAAWQAIPIKTMANALPTNWYYEATMPMAQVTLWPVPTDATNELILYYPAQWVGQFTTINTSVTLAPGLARALRLNLALEVANQFARPIPPGLPSQAAEALADFKRLNVPMMDLALDPGLTADRRGGYNILSDTGG